MNWYKQSQFEGFSDLSYQQKRQLLHNLVWEGKYRELSLKDMHNTITPEETEELNRLKKLIDEHEGLWKKEYKEKKPQATQNIIEGEPYKATQDHFIDYHYTGEISDSAYEDLGKDDGLDWLGDKNRYQILISKKRYGDEIIEFRQEDEDLKYVKTDEDGEVIRDEHGEVVYWSYDEMLAKNLPTKNTTIVAFNEQNKPIGLASDEWGSDGIWVIGPYQGKRIGTDLLYKFRKQFSHKRRIGQMTSGGRIMTRSYHRKLVQDAVKNNKYIPRDVLERYKNEDWAKQALLKMDKKSKHYELV